MILTLPNILTLSRIAIIPIVIALFYVDGWQARWITCGLFILAALTDWFDGYLARKQNQLSSFGRFLDPVADKLIVAVALVMLVAVVVVAAVVKLAH
jgi:cardiolipin synthase